MPLWTLHLWWRSLKGPALRISYTYMGERKTGSSLLLSPSSSLFLRRHGSFSLVCWSLDRSSFAFSCFWNRRSFVRLGFLAWPGYRQEGVKYLVKADHFFPELHKNDLNQYDASSSLFFAVLVKRHELLSFMPHHVLFRRLIQCR